MFMLTHTYFLQKVLSRTGAGEMEPDIYIYNIAPDLLAFHPSISAARTHLLQRSLTISSQYPKSAYVIYHLLIDDLSHHGYISSGFQEEFNVNSRGYSYVKGSHLIKSILNLYGIAGKKISETEAVYQSHLVIEMIYDLVILHHIHAYKTIDVLVDAVNYTANYKMDEFIATMNWLYDLDRNEIKEVMKNAVLFITKESMSGIMNIEGRINLFKDKSGLQCNERLFYDCLKDLFQQAIDLIDDDELFFQETTQVIKNYNTLPFLK